SYSKEEILENSVRELDHEFPVNPVFNYKELSEVAATIAKKLNNVIDHSYCPTIESARGNYKHRPIGIGIQGLANVFMKFKIAFESSNALKINNCIAEAIYYGALVGSTQCSKQVYEKT